MGRKVNIRSGGVTAARAEALAKRFLAGEATWEDLLASDALMVYSGDFKRHVASLCNVDPESGEPLSEPETRKEPPKADPKPESEPEPEPEPEDTEDETGTETSKDIELDEAEEAANGADGSEDETEAEADPETVDETEAETEEENVADESEPLAWDMCAWCAQGPATVCIDVSISQGGDRRLMRVDHVCDECAGAYWEAIRNAQFSRMSPDPEPNEEEEE